MNSGHGKEMNSNSEIRISLGSLSKRSFTFSDLSKADGGVTDEQRTKAAAAHLNTIVRIVGGMFPEVPASLSFVDFVFFSGLSNQNRKRKSVRYSKTIPARGYFAGYSPRSSEAFMDAVREHFRQGRVIMNHESFLAGFPAFSKNSPSIESYSASTLASVCREIGTHISEGEIPDVDFRYVEISFTDAEENPSPATTIGVDCAKWDVVLIDNDVELLRENSESSPAESMKAFASLLWAHRHVFCSASGCHFQHLYFVPISWLDLAFGTSRLSEECSIESAHGGAVIIGSAHRLTSPVCGLFSRLLSESVASTFLTSESFTIGASKGIETAIMAFGHQVKTLAAGISGHQKKWLFPVSKLEEFNQLGLEPPCEVTPVPRLFEALGKTISFWSLSHSKTALDLPDDFIHTLADVMRKACSFAESMRLASDFSRIDMSSKENLQQLKTHPKVDLQLEKLETWHLVRSKFQYIDDGDVIFDRHSSIDEQWKELAGLVRIFAIIVEGAIEYKPEGQNPRVCFKLPSTNLKNGRLIIVASNPCLPSDQRIGDGPARYIGMHGKEIRDFICERYLDSLDPQVPPPLDGDEEYAVTFDIKMPNWIEQGLCDE